jgi:superoxide dismutase
MKLHHGKHHWGSVDGVNRALDQLHEPLAEATAALLCKPTDCPL